MLGEGELRKGNEMNDAAVRGMREMWDDVTSVVKRKMTAREMAESSHELSRDGSMATMADGSMWVWDKRYSYWVMWKGV